MTDDTTDDTRRIEKGFATPSQPGDIYYCTPPAHSTVRHTLRHALHSPRRLSGSWGALCRGRGPLPSLERRLRPPR